jgi:hypothetical protein
VTGPPQGRQAEYRYGAVFLLTFALLVFAVAAPAEDWARAVAVALEFGALIAVVATSRARVDVRRMRVTVAAAVAVAVIVAIWAGAWSTGVVFVISGFLAAIIPIALVRGLWRLVREHGMTLQAVSGALAIYLLVGLLFAWTVGFVATLDNDQFFAEGHNAAGGSIVYYSFTVLTTTGFGDYTAATPAGQTLAVVEMLVGQLYLVTVIGVLVGGLARRSAG